MMVAMVMKAALGAQLALEVEDPALLPGGPELHAVGAAPHGAMAVRLQQGALALRGAAEGAGGALQGVQTAVHQAAHLEGG